MIEGEGNNSDDAYCHKHLGKVEVGNVGGVEVGKVEVDKVKIGTVGQSEVSKVGKVEIDEIGKVEVGKIGKFQVGKLGTAQLGNLDKPTSFNELEQHVGTSEEELINSTTKRIIKLLLNRGRLFKLSPFYDPDSKVVCVGGRLANSPYNIDKKFPSLIPKDSLITVLLIREAHARNLHEGPQLSLLYLRQTIWIPGGLSAVKKIFTTASPAFATTPGFFSRKWETYQQNVLFHLLLSPTLVWTIVDLSAQKTEAENCRRHMFPFLYVSAQRPFIWKQ